MHFNVFLDKVVGTNVLFQLVVIRDLISLLRDLHFFNPGINSFFFDDIIIDWNVIILTFSNQMKMASL